VPSWPLSDRVLRPGSFSGVIIPPLMPLAPGTKLGPYEIGVPLGAGGMAEVYRAKDTRLDRSVAIKILPAQFSADPVRKQRFEREAKTISSLNHPHICVLYDVGHQDGTDYLVMECVEGETLAKRLEKGPLPLEQVLKYGAQIADALDKAHRCGVVHRDLKPGNIMLTPTGVKLLDFGLAKPAVPLLTGATLTAMTPCSPMTEEGTIVGTFQYMSPEQIEGKEVDGRSDIFSLGAVLYEMLTGKHAFEGRSQLSVASAILEKEPEPISSFKPMTPPNLDHAIRSCLAKGPEERWQTARDLALELKWIAEGGSQAGALPAAQGRFQSWLGWGAAGIAAVLALIFGLAYIQRAPAPQRVIRSYILPPQKTSFASIGIVGGPPTISPDGLHIVFAATDESGKHQLWVQQLDSVSAQPLPGTENGTWPFWSPDSHSIGFFADGKLKKIEASGGPTETLCDAPSGRGGTWAPDGTILFNPSVVSPLYRVSEGGGTPIAVTKLDDSRHESSHRWPYFFPDGQDFVFFARGDQTGIYAAKLGSSQTKFLLATESNAAYASPGYLLFWRDGSLMAQPFDARHLELTGKPIPLAGHVLYSGGQSFGVFSVSQNGMLVLQSGETSGTQVAWFDRNGKQLSVIGAENGVLFGPRLSPDGNRLAVGVSDFQRRQTDIWLHDLSRGIRTRFTFESTGARRAINPVWSPDGKQIAFVAHRQDHLDIIAKSSSGAGGETILLEDASDKDPRSWSPDGRFLAYDRVDRNPDPRRQIWILPLSGDRKPFAFLPSLFREGSAEFSPDGQWMAYTSDESGSFQIYVASFPGAQTKSQVSVSGGLEPAWRADGKELFYLDLSGRLMAVDVKPTAGKLELGPPRMLFQTHAQSPGIRPYDFSRGADRFVITSTSDVNPSPFTLVVNWDAELRKK
jgi:eukaryotic-like serine/threonine-protein kinase